MCLLHYPYVHVEAMDILTAAIAAASFVDSCVVAQPLGKQQAIGGIM
jgi:hypothetical protein